MEKLRQTPNPIFAFLRSMNPSNNLTRRAEIKFPGFLAEHNLPNAVADHLSSLTRHCFPDSKIARSYSCARTKSSCILNGAIYPDLQQSLVKQMQQSVISLSTDGCNDQNLEKMNPASYGTYFLYKPT